MHPSCGKVPGYLNTSIISWSVSAQVIQSTTGDPFNAARHSSTLKPSPDGTLLLVIREISSKRRHLTVLFKLKSKIMLRKTNQIYYTLMCTQQPAQPPASTESQRLPSIARSVDYLFENNQFGIVERALWLFTLNAFYARDKRILY